MRRLTVSILLVTPMLVSCTGASTEEVLSVAAAPEPTVSAMPVPAYAAPEYSGPRLPGRWGIYVDAASAPTSFTSGDMACGGRTYELPAGTVIQDAVMQTSTNAFELARALGSPPRSGNIGGLTWALAIRVTRAEASFALDQGSANPVARADLKAEIAVLDKRGEVIRTMTESAAAISDVGSGGCNTGEAMLTVAYQRASNVLVSKVVPEIGTN